MGQSVTVQYLARQVTTEIGQLLADSVLNTRTLRRVPEVHSGELAVLSNTLPRVKPGLNQK